MSNYGVKISKKGENVLTVTNPRSFVERSNINILKISSTGSGTASLPNTTYAWTTTVTHNLGYKPQIFFYFKHPATGRWAAAPGRIDNNSPGTPSYTISASSSHDSDNRMRLRMEIDNSAPSYPVSVSYKYYILVEPRKDAWYE